jgi:hypothetical protein
MTSRGYVALEDGGGDLRIHQPRDVYGYDNLLFAPAEHPVAELVRCHGTGRTE